MIIAAVDLAPGDTITHPDLGQLTVVQKAFVSGTLVARDVTGHVWKLSCGPTTLVTVPDGRVLSTVEDLDELPIGAVVVTDTGNFGRGIAYRKQETPHGTTWYMPRSTRTSPALLLDPEHSAQPIRVLRAQRKEASA